ncbi:Transcription initiation factor TFIIIB, Bdp1 subunit [Pseudoloma neurophilia]|uniref:Transcription initiation factor TFIIIB, Bdp1 subunit n=1 Tax=Pseudoloma neurophilia TaxID=146866 RepID=A0A0R0LW10_9MICR|nr:Transcription initiation factor TFIIIB, Bdp1 subunit [Pseudoloma neurophilia]
MEKNLRHYLNNRNFRKKSSNFTPIDTTRNKSVESQGNKPKSSWQQFETDLFFKYLPVTGTDFSLLERYFKNKSRKQLKAKFKREYKKDSRVIDRLLAGKDCFIKDAGLKDIELKEIELKDIELKESKFKDIELKDIEFKDTELKESKFKEIESKDTELKESKFKDIELKKSKFKESEINEHKENINRYNLENKTESTENTELRPFEEF